MIVNALNITKTSGTYGASEAFANLPAGFRPNGTKGVVAYTADNSQYQNARAVIITIDGNGQMRTSGSAGVNYVNYGVLLTFNVSFVAVS